MSAIDEIRRYHDDLTAFRQDLHAHPELGLEEHRTADLVAAKLESYGIEVHRNVGKTGVVGVLRAGNGQARIGLRADMDALPIIEATGVPYASGTPGVMHACGHDGHTTMLLGAARYLAEKKDFNGTVHFIFQPGEEGIGGALAMLDDKLFERFPCDQVFGMHNRPGMPVGEFAICPGPAMAGGAFFDIHIEGKGSHGAHPEQSIDPVLIACHIGAALQSVVSRNIAPTETAVVSVTKIHSGDAFNVVPQSATLAGTARAFKKDVMAKIEERMRALVEGIAAAFGATATLDFRLIFAPLDNQPLETQLYADAAADLVGESLVDRTKGPTMGSEDFAFMMEKVPGAYILVGNGEGAAPHHPKYNFNDEAIPFGAGLYARLVERVLPKGV
ncbi:M20 aminoacylase family protein [Acidisphaera sp. L21]|uniref:M20 aminoacylase family protein n=1 Tax=Acidisphaera sp. L21 TaxID=1641851 RepID=UPI00131C898C|nr:M20 aminoacylase family protein [Acidisphaera sp. L21]